MIEEWSRQVSKMITVGEDSTYDAHRRREQQFIEIDGREACRHAQVEDDVKRLARHWSLADFRLLVGRHRSIRELRASK